MEEFKIHFYNTLPAAASVGPRHLVLVKDGTGLFRLFTKGTTGGLREVTTNQLEGVVRIVNGVAPNAAGEVVIDLEYNAATGDFNIKGSNSKVNLDARYVLKTAFDAEIERINTELANRAKLDGNNTFTGNNEFTQPVKVVGATGATHAVNKGQMDEEVNRLMDLIQQGLKTPKPFNASTATAFPTAQKGDTYKVIGLGPGETKNIGGYNLANGDTLIYDEAGNTPYVVQSLLDQGTETIFGVYKVAKTADVTAGTSDKLVVTPLKLKAEFTRQLAAYLNTLDTRYVRYDAAQTLNATQKATAQKNIGMDKAYTLGQADW